MACRSDPLPALTGPHAGVPGSGYAAQYAIEKVIDPGTHVVTVSGSSGTVVDEEGFTSNKLAALMQLENAHRGCLGGYAMRARLGHGVAGVAEDANMPCSAEAWKLFEGYGVL